MSIKKVSNPYSLSMGPDPAFLKGFGSGSGARLSMLYFAEIARLSVNFESFETFLNCLKIIFFHRRKKIKCAKYHF
jgi:hypothetical protein